MATITTKFAAPTNTRGARIIVKGFGKSKTISWKYAEDVTLNHRAAVSEFIKEFNFKNETHYTVKAFASTDIKSVDYVAIVE